MKVNITLIVFMCCMTLFSIVFCVSSCEYKSVAYKADVEKLRIEYYQENGYIRKYSAWAGYYWEKPDNTESTK